MTPTHSPVRPLFVLSLVSLSLGACGPEPKRYQGVEGSICDTSSDCTYPLICVASSSSAPNFGICSRTQPPANNPPAQTSCGKAGTTCAAGGSCCADSICVRDAEGSFCSFRCTSNAQCQSGCCSLLADGVTRACGAAKYCEGSTPPPPPQNECSKCLSACRGLLSCCTGTGCICESAC